MKDNGGGWWKEKGRKRKRSKEADDEAHALFGSAFSGLFFYAGTSEYIYIIHTYTSNKHTGCSTRNIPNILALVPEVEWETPPTQDQILFFQVEMHR